MNMQQVMQPRSANGFGRRRAESGNRPESKLQSGKSNTSRSTNAGVLGGGKSRGNQSPSRDRLVYMTTCLIGHHVNVQVKNGSIYTGIFHATNAEKDFGIILKMARLTRDTSLCGEKAIAESVIRAPSKTLIIPAHELVQVTAKEVAVTREGMPNDLHNEKEQEIMIDSFISHSRHADTERELERWVPDEDDLQPDLDNIFDGPWNSRSWDQFQANEALFGVKSTFDEELYTTKLERGPQMREIEREAVRIAREIEGEEIHDLHSAEERGVLDDKFDLDEETRFSSVFRGVDDSGYEENEEILVDSNNMDTFGGSSGSGLSRSFIDVTNTKRNDGAQASPGPSSLGYVLQDEAQSSQSSSSKDLYHSGSNDNSRQLVSSSVAKDGDYRIQDNYLNEQNKGNNNIKELTEKQRLAEEFETLKSDDSQSSPSMKKDDPDKAALSPDATAYAPSSSSSKDQEKTSSPTELSEVAASGKMQGQTQSVNTRGRPSSNRVIASAASSGPGLSPSSSVGSLSSEKSTLNPHAKEFKLNPNAKSFVPSHTPVRPLSPVSDGSFYYPSSGSAVPHMHGVPMGIGAQIGPSFTGHQSVVYNTQAGPMQSPPAYFHPNGPQYGQQMILGHTRPVLYMPGYPPQEMPYKGRDY